MDRAKIEAKAVQPAGVYRPQTEARVVGRAVISRFPRFMLARPKPAAQIPRDK